MHVHSGDGGGCICVRMPLLSGVRVLGTGAGGGGVAEVTGVGLDRAIERRQRAVGLTESWSRSQRGWQGTTRARAHKDTHRLSVKPQHLQGAPGWREEVTVWVSVPGAGRGRTRHAARQPRSPQRGAGGAVPGTAAGEKAAAPAMALAANRAAAFIVSSGLEATLEL